MGGSPLITPDSSGFVPCIRRGEALLLVWGVGAAGLKNQTGLGPDVQVLVRRNHPAEPRRGYNAERQLCYEG